MAKKPPVAPKGKADQAPETKTYLVGHTPILLDGERYESGEPIELTEAQAHGLDVRPAPTEQPQE